MPITALYAGLLAFLFVFLAVRVIRIRRRAKVALGDGGNPELLRAIRVQANCAEYVPMALLLLALAESVKTPAPLLHLVGAVLCVGRVVHAYGISQMQENFAFRVTGMATTFTVLLVTALLCIAGAAGAFAAG